MFNPDDLVTYDTPSGGDIGGRHDRHRKDAGTRNESTRGGRREGYILSRIPWIAIRSQFRFTRVASDRTTCRKLDLQMIDATLLIAFPLTRLPTVFLKISTAMV